MKKRILALMIVCLCLVLCGCCLQHEWTDATCTEPKTCAKCGATEGESLGHDWIEASCTEPKTCARCGATEGEPLGHEWTDATCTEPKTCSRCGVTEGNALGHSPTQADYQNPSVCTVCGAELAPRLEPELLKTLPGTFMEVGKTYDYHTVCYYNNSIEAVVKVEMVDYYTTEGNGRDLEVIDGYEWKVVTYRGIASGADVWKYYTSQLRWIEDLYDIELFDDTLVDGGGTGYSTASIRWNGEEYTCYFFDQSSRDDYEVTQSRGFIYTFYVCVPEGYDGIFIALTNSKYYNGQNVSLPEMADEDSLYFRLS